ncbi:unnamed protein product [Ophioblennius macclurei]
MFNWLEEWNISFAGCGFRSIYYVGALSCILERAPQLVHGASKICGASSGCLVAAALTVGISIEQLCIDILETATEARKHSLRVFHPTFSLLRSVRDSLLEKLPEDAHLRASGRLCVSLTRMSDMQNVLVSHFDTREELIQVLMCSCFFPLYSGVIPPTYRGVRYMDGALSNNVPLCELRNTIIVAPFSGESDICPAEGTYNALEVHYGNVSIQVNTGNVHRVCTSFLPPRLETLAEICHNGYMDTLCFLRERNLLGTRNIPQAGVKCCCEMRRKTVKTEEQTKKKTLEKKEDSDEEDHRWLDPNVIQNLPVSIQKVLCEACRNSRDGVSWWAWLKDPVKLITYLLSLLMLPVQLVVSFTQRHLMSANPYRPTRRTRSVTSVSPEPDSSSGFSDCTVRTKGDQNIKILRSFDKDLSWKSHKGLFSLNLFAPESPASSKQKPNDTPWQTD